MARGKGHSLFGHPFDVHVARKEEPVPKQTKEPEVPPDPMRNPDGSRIGIKRYCEMVTPSWNWEWQHLRYIDTFLDRVTSGEITRLIIELPTRIGKTEKVNVRYPAMRLEDDPTLPIIVAGYNDKFASRLSRKIKRIVAGRVQLAEDRKSSADWETQQGGGIRAAGVGVGIAGLPAALIMIDDPTKNREDAYSKAHRDKVWEWYLEDALLRLEPNGAIVITMARRHEDDLVGRILASDDAADWTVVRLPALAEEGDPLGRALDTSICEERFTTAFYQKLRKTIGEVSFAALQQQRPVPASGLVFQQDWLRYYTTREHPMIENGFAVPFLPDLFTQEIQSWDMSFKDKASSDYVAGHAWKRKGADCYFVARIHDRLNFPATLAAVRTMSVNHPKTAKKLVEDKANGPAVIASLQSEISGLIGVEPEGDKVSRAWAVTPMFESGNVWFPHPAIAPWIEKVKLEMWSFPLGQHDDDIDAMTQALRAFQKQLEIEERQREFARRQQRSASLVTLKQ